jgi:hypothetical protein
MAKAKLGSGARFKVLAKKVGSPALAAWIGRKKYGKKKMAKLSSQGRRQSNPTMKATRKIKRPDLKSQIAKMEKKIGIVQR